MFPSVVVVLGAVLVAPLAFGVAQPVADDLAQRRPVTLPPLRRWCALAVASPVGAGAAAVVAGAVALRWATAPVPTLATLVALGAAALACLVDLRCHRLPDVVVVPLGTGALLVAAGWSVAVGAGSSLVASAVAAAVATGLLGVGWVVGMGLGDVKFGAALAALAGWPVGSALGAVSVALAMIGLASMAATCWWGWVALRRRCAPRWFPFGPFLAAAAVGVVLVIGPPVAPGPTPPAAAPAAVAEPVRPAQVGHR